ncbi:hypothetical protein EDD18DRAFT_1103655 [Armillaria luteobubalina]|uniref:Heterokaryon incompatibility domain-containing protein n=1 Tax=Armillaria luteobubalina TaxID=153913 RepID=A0AA39QCA6_9AGAR|nr:hypothetical protein EDD18DRAFT_1103655 [Armillaria luteobubalina]
MYGKPDYPKITLSAHGETGHTELTIPVLKQQSYTGNEPVISSAPANTPCAELGINGVFERLNATLATSQSQESEVLRPGRKTTLHSILEPYVARNDDFGTMPYCTVEEEARKMWRNALMHDRIITTSIPPRRMWDLYTNRVVPSWVGYANNWGDFFVWGISHAWVDKKECMPMPKDTNLDLIRIEMLNLGAQYVWLDVLCLRQEGGKDEYLRLDEWKLDVPTIGWVYQNTRVGRPLHLTPDYFESDRCWFRRAWTLQEINSHTIIGGEAGDDIMDTEVRKVFDKQLAHLWELQKRKFVLELASEMQNRV